MDNTAGKVFFTTEDGKVIWNDKLHGVEFDSNKKHSVNSVYDKKYYNDGYISKTALRLPHYRKIVDAIQPYANSDLLDIGSGAGLFLHEAEKQIIHCCGIEPSSAACEFAKNYCTAEIINDDPLNMPENWNYNKFNIVTILDVLAHVDFPAQLLTQCRKYLKENGILVLKTPNHPADFYDYIGKKYAGSSAMCNILAHLPHQRYGWGISGITELVTDCGFQILTAEPFDEFQTSWKFHFRDIIHPRRILYKYKLQAAEKFLGFSSILLIAKKSPQ